MFKHLNKEDGEYRKPYRKSKAFDYTCRNHGPCKYCYDNRTFSSRKSQIESELELKEIKNMSGQKNLSFKSIPCIICGAEISDTFGGEEINAGNVDCISSSDGAIGKISYGYGSELDGNVYIIGICKACTKKEMSKGRISYMYNYLDPL